MNFIREMVGGNLVSRAVYLGSAGLLCALLFLALCAPVFAQSPIPAATNPTNKDNGGFTPGWTLGARFEGSYSSDAGVYDLGTALGYNFSRHFGIDAGVPFYFITTPTSIKQSNPGAVSGVGIGSFFTDLRWNYPNKSLNYSSAIHLTAPTADTKKGLSTGHATWNFNNHFDHAFGDWSPFIEAGVGNSLMDTRFFTRPFTTFGFNAAFAGGLEYDKGPFSLSAGAYDVAPWGNQTVISRVFRCGSAAKCNASGTSTNRNGFTSSSVTTGGAGLVRDNGYEAGINFKPRSIIWISSSTTAAAFLCTSTTIRSASASISVRWDDRVRTELGFPGIATLSEAISSVSM